MEMVGPIEIRFSLDGSPKTIAAVKTPSSRIVAALFFLVPLASAAFAAEASSNSFSLSLQKRVEAPPSYLGSSTPRFSSERVCAAFWRLRIGKESLPPWRYRFCARV